MIQPFNQCGHPKKLCRLIAGVTLLAGVVVPVVSLRAEPIKPGTPVDGYRGIWFELGQKSEFGDKYSGGLGTYTANHIPMAVYAERVNKTFFVYGGTTSAEARHLLCMIGVLDHATGEVSRPVVVHDKEGVDDPHDNPSVNIDAEGYVYVLVSGRGKVRPGFKYRSSKPYDVSAFDLLETKEMTYPQFHVMPGGGMFLLFTKYTAGRELYWQRSDDGKTWTEDQKLAGMGGHYQVSNIRPDGTIGSAFMYHPEGDVDRRTNLYYVQTADQGRTWTTADGKAVDVPLTDPKGPGLVFEFQSRGQNVYIHDLNFDADGRPVVLFTTSHGAKPGPASGPYEWHVAHWDGTAWRARDVAASDHCYDAGSIYVEGGTWRIIGPTGIGPQQWGAGGEMSLWTSDDRGVHWTHVRQITTGSAANHSYARRPRAATDPFYAFWADGDASAFGRSHLFFTNRTGDKVWQLPYDMAGDSARPLEVQPVK